MGYRLLNDYKKLNFIYFKTCSNNLYSLKSLNDTDVSDCVQSYTIVVFKMDFIIRAGFFFLSYMMNIIIHAFIISSSHYSLTIVLQDKKYQTDSLVLYTLVYTVFPYRTFKIKKNKKIICLAVCLFQAVKNDVLIQTFGCDPRP